MGSLILMNNYDNELVKNIINILEDKKALNINVIDVREKSILADYFVIANGTSSTHINALADEIEFRLKQENIFLNSREGKNYNSWILLDYGEVIVHIFSEETRKFYNLEGLWSPKIK